MVARGIIMIDIIINGVVETMPNETTISDIIRSKNYKNVIVWLNDNKLLKKEYDVISLKNKDNIRIMRVLGGG